MSEKNEKEGLPLEKGILTDNKLSQINLVMSDSDGEDIISLANIIYNMRTLGKEYLWRMLLFAVAGVSIALLIYQFTHQPSPVSSV
ncbi:MAG: hypothetical protein IKN07_09785, partial [Lachnospiraceae bacterium]|nr:hypothetical protein [Lachnospiraceae bacterium]